jgi:hypothetical protein
MFFLSYFDAKEIVDKFLTVYLISTALLTRDSQIKNPVAPFQN